MKKSHLYLSLLCGIMAGILLPFVLQSPVHAETNPSDNSSSREEKLLSTHQTEARFDGIQFIPCRFMSSLCPDKCGHAKNVAVFTIIKYIDYKKVGEYGDGEQTVFFIDVSSPILESSPEATVRKMIANMKEGEFFNLNWKHIYVTEQGNSFPMRLITLLEKIKLIKKANP